MWRVFYLLLYALWIHGLVGTQIIQPRLGGRQYSTNTIPRVQFPANMYYLRQLMTTVIVRQEYQLLEKSARVRLD